MAIFTFIGVIFTIIFLVALLFGYLCLQGVTDIEKESKS